MDVRLGQLRTFVAVVDAGTFTDAAEVLGVTQASVSRSVAALERALGARLLERTTRHVALTDAGARALAVARRVLEEMAHLRRAVEETRTELRLGYAWSTLGRYTRALQRRWASSYPRMPLIFVQTNTPTAGLSEGVADIAVLRRPVDDPRLESVQVGVEPRFAAMASDHPLARRRSVRLAEVVRFPVAIDWRTGTTTPELFAEPARIRVTHGVDEWLILIASGAAVGITSQATAHQHPRPGVAYRPVRDAPPIPVRLAWWRDEPPTHRQELLDHIQRLYGGA